MDTLPEGRPAFVREGWRLLEAGLRQRIRRLHVRIGDTPEVLPRVLKQGGARAIYTGVDYTPFAQARVAHVARAIPLHHTRGLTLEPPRTILTHSGEPHRVFNPLPRAWRKQIEGSDLRPRPAQSVSLLRRGSPRGCYPSSTGVMPQVPQGYLDRYLTNAP